MKTVLLSCLALILAQLTFAQAPKQFNYQAVARDQSGVVITGPLEIKISLLEGSENGTPRYAETHSVTTNAQGVLNLVMGKGVVVSGDMDNVKFDQYNYWLKTEIKLPGAVGFTEMGKTQLLSVPYALYADRSGMQPGAGIDIVDGTIINTGDLSDDNELQSLSLNGAQLSISNGNTVTLPTGTTYTAGAGITINGNKIAAVDPDPGNEIQSLSLNGPVLSISNGNSVNLPTYSAGAGITINNSQVSAMDASATNEIQTLSLNGNQLSLSNGGGSVQLPGGNWSLNNGTEITSTPTSNSVVIGSNSHFGSKLYVASTGTDHAGNFFSPGTGNALMAYNNGTGAGIMASSLHGTGANFSSVDGYALITGSGNVGIGLTNPTEKLQVNGTIRTVGIISTSETDRAAKFTSGNKEAVLIYQYANQFHGIKFLEKYNNWDQAIDGNGDMGFKYNDVEKAWFSHADGSYHNSSDRALKKDIEPFSNVLGKLTQLQAYTYHMKDAADDSPISVGFMAQEVEAQFPELVTYKDGYRSLCYDHFAVLSVQAIKEQQKEIEEQQSIILQQQHDIATLHQEFDALKAFVQQQLKK
jgi:hypothetical protein